MLSSRRFVSCLLDLGGYIEAEWVIIKIFGVRMKKSLLSLMLAGCSVLSLSGCLLAAGAAGGEAAYVATQDDRTAGQTIDDQVIHTSIKSKLLADPDVSGLDINVDVNKGQVQLRGYVKTQKEIDRAVQIAQLTDGVKGVESRLVLDKQ